MLEYAVLPSLSAIDREQWNRCFSGQIETYDYLLAVEQANLPGFEWRYLIARDGPNVVAAAPAFLTEYPLETTLVAHAKSLIQALRRLAPGLLTIRLGCVGSPCTENAMIGFEPGVMPEERARLLRNLISAFERSAKCGLIALKDVDDASNAQVQAALAPLGYRALEAEPSAHLTIDFADVDTYLARLTSGTRKDMRRKLKALANVRVEIRRDLRGYEDDVLRLYNDTRARAEMTFEELTVSYFTGVLSRMPDRALCVLYFVGDDLLAANLLLRDETQLLDKFFVMDGARGREHNLYYLSWFTNLRLCLDMGLTRYLSGQAGYANKVRLGSRLTRNYFYFRHRNGLVNRVLHFAATLMSPTHREAAA